MSDINEYIMSDFVISLEFFDMLACSITKISCLIPYSLLFDLVSHITMCRDALLVSRIHTGCGYLQKVYQK